jgi:hypothetical protein
LSQCVEIAGERGEGREERLDDAFRKLGASGAELLALRNWELAKAGIVSSVVV